MLSNLDAFVSFPWVIALARTSVQCWTQVRRADILVLFVILGGRLSVFYLEVWCYLWFLYMSFIMLRKFLSICSLLTAFAMNDFWILLNAFSACIKMLMCFLPFLKLMCYITLILICWTNPPSLESVSPGYDIYIVKLGLLLLCWGFLYLYSKEIVVYCFLFLWLFWSGFGMIIILVSYNALGNFLSSSFWESLWKFAINFLQTLGRIHWWGHLGLSISLWEGFWWLIPSL